MDSLLTTFNAQLGKVRREVINGRSHLVAPFTSLAPRVLPGSRGPLFYPESEIAANPGVWNHIPLTLGHPSDPLTNVPLSARSPHVVNRVKLGEIYEDHVENGHRKGEAWFDEELTKNKSPKIWQTLNDAASGKRVPALELSTGLFTENIEAARNANHDGVSYTHIATNLRPDHLAVFEPGTQRGACNTDQGCGILNSNPEGHNQYTGSGGERREYLNAGEKTDAQVGHFRRIISGLSSLTIDHPSRAADKKKVEDAVEGLKKLGFDRHGKPLTKNQEEQVMNESPQSGFWKGLVNWLVGNADQPRHLESGQMLPKGSKVSGKQVEAAVKAGFGLDTGSDGGGDELETNSNPEGHNQYTGGSEGKGLEGKTLKAGDVVKFHTPGKGEDDSPMHVVEDRGDRVLVEHRKGFEKATLKPQASYMKKDLTHNTDDGGQVSRPLVDGKRPNGLILDALGKRVENEGEDADPMAMTGTGMSGSPMHVGPTGNKGAEMKCPKCGAIMTANAKGGMTCNCGHTMNAEQVANAFPPPAGGAPKPGAAPAAPAKPPVMIPHEHLRDKVHQAIQGQHTQDEPSPNIEAMHDDHAIYSVGDKLHRQPFQADDQGNVKLSGKPVPVQRQTTYAPVQNEENPMKLTVEQRKAHEGFLVANCDCWKGKQAVLNTLPDDVVDGLVKNEKSRAESVLVVNAVKNGIDVGNGLTARYDAEAKRFTFNAQDVIATGGESVQAGGEEGNEQEEEGDLDSAKVAQVGDAKVKSKPTINGWLASAPDEVKEVVANALQVRDAEIKKLIGFLTANVKDEATKKRLVANYATMKLPVLRDMAAALPSHVRPLVNAERIEGRRPNPIYGARPQVEDHDVTANAQDILPMPTFNWETDEAKAERTAAARA